MSSLLAVLTVVALHAYTVSAQGTNVTCDAAFSWATNSRGQSPCLQAAYLNGACLNDPQDAYVYSLPADFHYRPPTLDTATPCQCSTVFYSMIGACAGCQDRDNLPWSAWDTNCTAVYIGWPSDVPIPPGTSIPSWAFIDVVEPDAFNATAAKAIAATDPAESSPAVAPPTSSSSSFIPSASAGASNNAPASPTGSSTGNTSSSSSSHKSSNVGAIVGGVVGGLGGAAILCGIAAYFMIRQRKKNAAKTDASAPFAGSGTGYAQEHEPKVFQHQQAEYTGVPTFSPTSPSTYTAPLYNPDDPSTFPGASDAAPGTQGGYASSHSAAHQQPGSPFEHTPGRYTGVAEV
ncbi:hypothetical protein BC835DRAFT_999872 [Cytidiella melzeri]|nr:hypothetical protein BC835DRAFT_999872 [Cytidiella melzeri]